MPVSKSLVDSLGAKYGGTKPPVATSATPKQVAAPAKTTPVAPKKPAPAGPSIWDQMKAAPKTAVTTATKAVADTAKAVKPVLEKAAPIMAAAKVKDKELKTAALKESLKSLDYDKRQALRKYAVPTANGFMLPSIDNPELAPYEGLTFTNDEWAKGFSAVSGNKSTIGPATGKYEVVDEAHPKGEVRGGPLDTVGGLLKGATSGPWYEAIPKTLLAAPLVVPAAAFDLTKGVVTGAVDLGAKGKDAYFNALYGETAKAMIDNESQRQANARRQQTADRLAASGLDYLARLQASQPIEEHYNPTDWSNPMTYGNDLYRIGKETVKAAGAATIQAGKALAGTVEKNFLNDPYFHWAGTLGAQLADEATVALVQHRELNPDVSVANNPNRFTDPAYYATAFASAIPHFVGSIMASTAGAAIGGGTGAAIGAFTYGSSIEGGMMYNQMLEQGHSLDDARFAGTFYGNTAGALDALLPGELGGKVLGEFSKRLLVKGVQTSLKKEIFDWSARGALDFLKEGGTEAAQQIMQNTVQRFYGDQPDIWEGVVDAFVGGGLVGLGSSLIDGKPNFGEHQNMTPQQDTATETNATVDSTKTPPDTKTASVEVLRNDMAGVAAVAAQDDAAIKLGEKMLENDPGNTEIQQIVDEAKQHLEKANDVAQTLTVQYLHTTQTSLIDNGTVKVFTSQTPDGKYSASATMNLGNRAIAIPYDGKASFTSAPQAATDSVSKLESWFLNQLSHSGVINNQQAQDAVASIAHAKVEITAQDVKASKSQAPQGLPVLAAKAARYNDAHEFARAVLKEGVEAPAAAKEAKAISQKMQNIYDEGMDALGRGDQEKVDALGVQYKQLEGQLAALDTTDDLGKLLDGSPNLEENIQKLVDFFNGLQQEGEGTPPKEPPASEKKATRDKEDLVSRVSERMVEQYPELGEASTYERMGIKDEIEKGLKLLAKDKQEAYRVAMGVTNTSEHERTAVNIVMTEKALAEGNFDLAARLIKNRSLRQTDFGQSIVLEKASINDNSPQRYMKELLATRFNAVGNKYLEGLTDKMLKRSSTKRVMDIIDGEVKTAKRAISKEKKFDLKQAQDFISQLACN